MTVVRGISILSMDNHLEWPNWRYRHREMRNIVCNVFYFVPIPLDKITFPNWNSFLEIGPQAIAWKSLQSDAHSNDFCHEIYFVWIIGSFSCCSRLKDVEKPSAMIRNWFELTIEFVFVFNFLSLCLSSAEIKHVWSRLFVWQSQ